MALADPDPACRGDQDPLRLRADPTGRAPRRRSRCRVSATGRREISPDSPSRRWLSHGTTSSSRLIQAELRRSGYEELIPAGVVLTGGTSKMEGAVELAEEIFHMPVRGGVAAVRPGSPRHHPQPYLCHRGRAIAVRRGRGREKAAKQGRDGKGDGCELCRARQSVVGAAFLMSLIAGSVGVGLFLKRGESHV